MGKRIIITGATGYVGEGVLLESLEHPEIGECPWWGASLADGCTTS